MVIRVRVARLFAVLVLLGVTASCAYYNTFYLARKYYMKATDGQPYEVDRDGTTQRANYTKSADYAKKLLGVYPKSKFVDDAWLMWARTLLGTDDPLKAVAMLQEFQTRFPKSELRPDAEFFLGLAYRAARKHEQAVTSFDEFLAQAPKHQLVPYAYYERSKAYMSLQRYREAAESAGQVLEHYPGHVIYDKALRQRAEARYQQRDWVGARADFHNIGERALSDEERQRFLLREVDCLESSRGYDEARALLRDARSHVLPPPPLPVVPRVGGVAASVAPASNMPAPTSMVRTPAQEQYGRLTLRMGGVELLAGHVDQAVEFYRSVLHDYPRSQLSAEAQFRIGYAYETGADDFERARAEYAHVREETGVSQFAQQAQQRLDNLDRIDRYRTAGGQDSLARKAEGRFLVAEHYLFNLERPDRAVEEYHSIFDSVSIPSVRARALNAQAWVLSRKLDRKVSADSLFWKVVREYPATEAQLAARDYLESEGHTVPESLIVAPKEIAKPLLDTTAEELKKPPTTTPRLGSGPGQVDPGSLEYGPNTAPGSSFTTPAQWRSSTLTDSLRRSIAMRDSLIRLARSDTSAAGRARVDSLRRAMARPDTLGRGMLMARIANEVARAGNVVVAPDSSRAPDFTQADTLVKSPGALLTPGARAPLPGAPRVDMPVAAKGTAADSARRAVRVDSTHKSMLSNKRVNSRADSLARLQVRVTAAADSVRRNLAAADSVRRASHADSLAVQARAVQTRATAAADSSRRIAAAADSVRRVRRAYADSLRSAASADSMRIMAKAAKHVLTDAERDSKSITSWDTDKPRVRAPKLSAAQRDSARRDERLRAEAKRDSLKHLSAERDSLKRAVKAARGKPTPVLPDSTPAPHP